ncbi:MAG: hypothetical protein GWO07_05835 [Candidatus Dadabacteria bacterium]|nr:hypothetical protein [Candidatus Dadabacteria bacterium]NIS08275.1 hypothetical protein [Candidatus Dadabacteria bacterium]NIY21760.1 hypothetical protein [Candidatus Dadabacteria bacterium]
MRIILKLLPLLLVFFNLTAANSKDKYVFLITIDGLRPDAISEQVTPNLSSLLKKSSYSLGAQTVYPSSTMPSHTSLFTGLDAKNHKNTLNDYRVINKLLDHGKYLPLETIFTLAEKKKIRTTFICGKNKIRFLIKPLPGNHINCYDIYDKNDNIVGNITNSFTSRFKDNYTAVNFIHYPEPDISGHKHGWMNSEYLESLRKVDGEIKRLLTFLDLKMAEKQFLLIITADHGGTEKSMEQSLRNIRPSPG